MDEQSSTKHPRDLLAPDELGAAGDPYLWLQERVLSALNRRIGTGKPWVKQVYAEPYYGKTAGMWGYSFCFEVPHTQSRGVGRYLMLSRTHVAESREIAQSNRPTLKQIMDELENGRPNIPYDKFGHYHNDLPAPGTYATIECNMNGKRFFYMVSESGRRQPYYNYRWCFPGLGT